MIDFDLRAVRTPLLRWYDEHKRDLPWRYDDAEAPDPYRVWLSEAMLQQTRVETVRPYFQRWTEQFPTLADLAEASLEDVLKAWEGLGYYSRARNLHRAVREVRDRFDGKVPDDLTTFRSLPGVGRYTAGAVMSIAFDQPHPVVDGNVRRVFARWLDLPEPDQELLWSAAGKLVRGNRPGALNQALMELGATVCTPRSPRCGICPVADRCRARAAGTQEQRPLRRKRAPLPQEDRVAAIVEQDGALLMARRRPEGRLGGMWEFPGGPVAANEAPSAAAERLLPLVSGVQVEGGETVAVVDHTFTHVRVSYHAVRAWPRGGEATAIDYDEVRWMPAAAVRDLALPRAQQRILALASAIGAE